MKQGEKNCGGKKIKNCCSDQWQLQKPVDAAWHDIGIDIGVSLNILFSTKWCRIGSCRVVKMVIKDFEGRPGCDQKILIHTHEGILDA